MPSRPCLVGGLIAFPSQRWEQALTSSHLVAFAVIWVLLMVLAGLVGVLYRQVDRLYRGNAPNQAVGLPVGSQVPAVSVLDGPRELTLTWADRPGPEMIAILSSTCGGCESLVEVMREEDPLPGMAKTFLVTDGPGPSNLRDVRSMWPAWTAAHPADLVDAFEVKAVPLVMIAVAGRVAAIGTPTDRTAVEALAEHARVHHRGQQGISITSKPT